jgi:hypothetical protein
MPRIDVSAPFAREAARLARIGVDGDKALQRARSTLARRLPVAARRDMQDEYALKASRINDGLSTRTEADAVVLTGSKRGIGLIEFGGKWAGRKSDGATAQVRRTEGRGTYGGTFIAAGKSGNRQIFTRTTKARLPLRALYGPSIADMLKNAPRRARLADFAQDVLAAEINRLLGVR